MHRILTILSIVLILSFGVQALGPQTIKGSFSSFGTARGDSCTFMAQGGILCVLPARHHPTYYLIESSKGPVRVRDLGIGYSPRGSIRGSSGPAYIGTKS